LTSDASYKGLFALEPVVITGVLLLLMGGGSMLTDGAWMSLEPLLEACRPKGKTPPQDLRRTISAIVWRHQNGAKWRAIPAELGPWSRAAQTFIRWAHLGVWERLLLLAQERGVQLGMTFLDGTSIRAHHKAAGAEKRGPTARVEMSVRRLAARVAATAPRRA
jgi:transposase